MEVTTFKGMNNSKGKKNVDPIYFYDVSNFNYDSIVGADKIKFPSITYDGSGTDSGYLIYEYRYLDQSNVLQKESVSIIGSTLYKNFQEGFPVALYTGLTETKASAVVYQDKLFIANGKDYPLIYNGSNGVVHEMGSPEAIDKITTGNLNGEYYYEMTYVTAAGEERIGTKSNTITISNGQVLLNIPVGYDGTTSRKIYRTEAGGTALKLLTTIADNTTLTYTDNTADGSLTTDIIAVNNACPKPYFLAVSAERLVGAMIDLYPTQLPITDTNIEVFDFLNTTDISNQTGDNSPVKGIGNDYNKLIVGSEKNIYLVDVSGSSATVTPTQAKLGMKDGHTVVNIPTNEGYTGGIGFISTENDFRQFTGNIAIPVATSLDNLNTTDLSSVIKDTFEADVKNSSNLHAAFFENKYHLVVDQKYHIYDTRIGGWASYFIKTNSYTQELNVLGVFDADLYSGGVNNSLIEKHYQETTYRSEEVGSSITTAQLLNSDKEKYIKSITIFYKNLETNKWKITVTLNSKFNNNTVINANFEDGSYLEEYYNANYYETVTDEEDYRVIHINKWAKWLEIKIEPQEGLFYFRGYKIDGENVANKEMPV